ncbi:MAG: hypothetical protein LBK99_18755 [Opitutaceae bacterium]|jgi:hypothetical protein|nr:hypothetical protein [Opitutaceae bacterium]
MASRRFLSRGKKIDEAWLTTQRPEIVALRSKATAFPVIEKEIAQQKLDTVRKQFSAPKNITYTARTNDGQYKNYSVPNAMAEKYFRNVRSITPDNITFTLKQIVATYERDATATKGALSGTADAAQRAWLTDTFRFFISSLIRLQSELDPVHAGDVQLPSSSSAQGSQKNEWFERLPMTGRVVEAKGGSLVLPFPGDGGRSKRCTSRGDRAACRSRHPWA